MAGKSTQLVHLGRTPQHYQGAVNTPTIRSSTIIFPDYDTLRAAESGTPKSLTYGRHGTDTRHHLEQTLATLDGMERCFLAPSGLAAITFALSAFLQPGDHVLVADTVYGPTRLYCTRELKRLGVEVTFYDPAIGAGIADMFRETTRVVFVESPGSVTFELQDIPAIAEVAHRNHAVVLADNTWATPLAPTPAGLGVDVIIHSLTKYVCGHSDVLMGSVTASGAHAKRLETHCKLLGMAVSADDCFLVARGLRTMAVRVKEQEKNALTIARWLQERPEVSRILHPALESFPDHALWQRDIGMACGLFAFIIHPVSEDALANMLDNMHYFGMGYSWGGYESLLIPHHPQSMRTATKWEEPGILLRIHVGLEDVDDLIADLEAGLARLNAAA